MYRPPLRQERPHIAAGVTISVAASSPVGLGMKAAAPVAPKPVNSIADASASPVVLIMVALVVCGPSRNPGHHEDAWAAEQVPSCAASHASRAMRRGRSVERLTGCFLGDGRHAGGAERVRRD